MTTKTKTVAAADFKGKSLLITTPAYGGMVNSNFAVSVSRAVHLLTSLRVKHDVFFLNNESLITRARNTCVAHFMTTDFSHMIFIDADTEFDPNDVVKFLYSDEDVLTGAVPQKTLPIKYNTVVITDPEGNAIVHKDRFVEVEYTGTAFMMIKREVIQKMFNHYSDLKYEIYEDSFSPTTADKEKFKKHCYALFDTALSDHRDSGLCKRYFAEDYMFCYRWRSIGGKILLDPSVKLNHAGAYVFKGDVSKICNDLK